MPKVTPCLVDPTRSRPVMKAIPQIGKIDNGGLKRAYAGE
jgi:hypothetical protein